MTLPRLTSLRASLSEIGDWFLASDPGLNRLLMAARGVAAVGTALGVEWIFSRSTGAGAQGTLIAMLLGAIVGMMGSMALSSGGPADKALTAASFPVAIGIGMAIGTAVAANTDLLLWVFVAILFVAVYVRRFGMRFFFAGFMFWMGYFFASFLGATIAQLPGLILDVIVGAATVLLLSLTLLRENSARTMSRTLRAFSSRAESLARRALAALDNDDEQARRALTRQQRLLNEAALMIEGQLGDAPAAPGRRSARSLRRLLVDAQLALEEIALTVLRIAGDASGIAAPALRRMLVELAQGEPGRAAAAAADVDQEAAGYEGELAHLLRRAAAAAREYAACRAELREPETEEPTDEEEFESSVTMMMGRLPGSAAIASGVQPSSARWNPLARLPLTTRQAIQAALAGGLSILAGRALSPHRYYWAVIAAFITFTGTATRSEATRKAVNRIIGTAAGLGVAIVLAEATAGNGWAALAVILGSMFVGFYLLQISYAIMIFFITIMVAQLYSVLHVFTSGLLLLRLEETGIGGGIGIVIGLLVLPLSTRDIARAARSNYFGGLHDLLDAACSQLDGEDTDADLDGLARGLDSHLHQLTQILQPLTNPLALRADRLRIQERIALFTLLASAGRQLASSIRRFPHRRTGDAVVEAIRTLAAAAQALRDLDGPTEHAGTAAFNLDGARDAVDSAADEADESIRPLVDALTRIHLVLRRLTGKAPKVERSRRKD